MSKVDNTNKKVYSNKFLSFLDNNFEISKRNSNFKTEIIGGLIVFVSMVYIIFVQASILSEGIAIWNTSNPDQVFDISVETIMIITAITAALSSIIMGVYAKYPVSLASGMGINAFVAYSLLPVIGPYGSFLAIFLSGVLFLVVSFTGMRKRILASIPDDIKTAIAVGVGFFIVYVALANSGIIVQGNGTPTGIGDLSDPAVLVGVFGIILTIILFILGYKAASIMGIGGAILFGLILNYSGAGVEGTLPEFNFDSLNYGEAFKDLGEFAFIPFRHIADKNIWASPEFYLAIFILFLTDFFDTSGTLFSINEAIDSDAKQDYDKNIDKALKVDAISTTVCSLIGATNVTSYAESISGVTSGARTGLAPVVTGTLFLLSIPLIPLFGGLVTSATTAGALFIVGVLMFRSIVRINLKETPILISSFVIIIFTLLTYSIGTGIVFGLLFYIISMVASNRYKEVDVMLYAITPLLLAFIILPLLL